MTLERRETLARVIGGAVALVVMIAAWRIIRWPAPAIAAGLGLGAYLLARPGARPEGS